MSIARMVHCPQHARHHGACPACQRARLAAEQQQLVEVRAINAAAESEVRDQADVAVSRGDQHDQGPRT